MKLIFAALYQTGEKLSLGAPHTTRRCAEDGVSPFEGAMVVGFVTGVVDLLPEPVLGMTYALNRAAALATDDAGPDDPDELVPGEGFEAIEVLQAIAEKLGVSCTQEAIEEALDELLADA